LVLSSNQLTTLPTEIGNLTDLTSLVLSYNQLTTLPAEIGSLQNLTSLDLSFNQLTALPTEIGKLTNITSLDLSYNQLTALPPEIEKLTLLTTLWLAENKIPLEARAAIYAKYENSDCFVVASNLRLANYSFVDSIPMADLQNIDSLKFDDEQFEVIEFYFSTSINGYSYFKAGNSPKLPQDLLTRLKTGDVFFIENIKIRNRSGKIGTYPSKRFVVK
jgi:hypothetical protein